MLKLEQELFIVPRFAIYCDRQTRQEAWGRREGKPRRRALFAYDPVAPAETAGGESGPTGRPARLQDLCGPALENLAGAGFNRCHYKVRTRGEVVSVQRGTQSRVPTYHGGRHIHIPPPASWPHAGCLLAAGGLWFQLLRAWWALLCRCSPAVVLVLDFIVCARGGLCLNPGLSPWAATCRGAPTIPPNSRPLGHRGGSLPRETRLLLFRSQYVPGGVSLLSSRFMVTREPRPQQMLPPNTTPKL